MPIGGIGSRFKKEGYRFPKPFINMVGRPMLFWLLDRLSLTSADSLWVAIDADIAYDLQVEARLKAEYHWLSVNVIKLGFDTCGAAETLFIVTQGMDERAMGRRTIALDCDTIYFDDVLAANRKLPRSVSACVYFEDTSDLPLYSYLVLDHSGRITDIKEKIAVSKHANTGAYSFASAALLKKAASEVISGKLDASVGEYYTSAVVLKLIKDGHLFLGVEMDKDGFTCVGTPAQLESFLDRIQQEPSNFKQMRFCFDLDGTLVTAPKVPGDYSTCQPIMKNVMLVRELHESGHHIIVQTARRMRTHNGNVGRVIKDIGSVTIKSLEECDIPYDELHFGKPFAHVYVDDLAVNAVVDTLKELGWKRNKKTTPKAMIQPRAMNFIQVIGNDVLKTSRSREILGEIYFFSRIPDDISTFFPKLSAAPTFSGCNFVLPMEKVSGITFSHLLSNRAVTDDRLRLMMDAVFQIHQSDGKCSKPLELCSSLKEQLPTFTGNPSIYLNYAAKVESRFKKHYVEIYKTLDSNVDEFFKNLLNKLLQYESNKEGKFTKVIHGDAVFSNVLLQPKGSVMFIDMRGSLGDYYTCSGDQNYDLAKVYQCLWGYDFIIGASHEALIGPLESVISEQDERILANLRTVFWDFVKDKYGLEETGPIKALTAGLYFSMMPFHDEFRWPHFYELGKRVFYS